MFLNSNGHGQALQFLAQGYSDSIRARTSNQGVAMANAFNQGLSNAVQTHDNHEQALQNREATRLQNEYMNRTMDDRVRHQAQQTEANDYALDFTKRTQDDRVLQEGTIKTNQALSNLHNTQLVNEGLGIRNYIADQTAKSTISSTNSQNYKDAADADKQRDIIKTQHSALKGTPHYKTDESGQPYMPKYDKNGNEVGRDYISPEMKAHIDETNKQQAETLQAIRQGETSRQQANTAGLQAQTAENINRMNNENELKAMYDEAKGAIQGSGDTKAELVSAINFAMANGETEITLKNGTKMPIQMAQRVVGYPAGANGGGIGGGSSNINVQGGRLSDTQYGTKMMSILKDPNATEEQKRDAQSWLSSKKTTLVEGIRHKVSNISHMTKSLDLLTGADRVEKGIGLLTQYFGGDFAQLFGNLQAAEKDSLITLATNSMKGALSDKDMKIANTLIPEMWKSNSHGMGVALQAVNKMIEEIEGYSDTYGEGVFTDEHKQKIQGLYLLRDKLSRR